MTYDPSTRLHRAVASMRLRMMQGRACEIGFRETGEFAVEFLAASVDEMITRPTLRELTPERVTGVHLFRDDEGFWLAALAFKDLPVGDGNFVRSPRSMPFDCYRDAREFALQMLAACHYVAGHPQPEPAPKEPTEVDRANELLEGYDARAFKNRMKARSLRKRLSAEAGKLADADPDGKIGMLMDYMTFDNVAGVHVFERRGDWMAVMEFASAPDPFLARYVASNNGLVQHSRAEALVSATAMLAETIRKQRVIKAEAARRPVIMTAGPTLH